jgi:3-deoxy-D-arabino-heptulosonate 7-phosphate (DAHP) synthase
VAQSSFVLVDLSHRDLRRAITRPVAGVALAGAVGVVASVLHASGRRFPRQSLEKAMRRAVSS